MTKKIKQKTRGARLYLPGCHPGSYFYYHARPGVGCTHCTSYLLSSSSDVG